MGIRRQALMRLALAAPGYFGGQLRNPIFIIGIARSGTTLLNDLLAQHPHVAALSEANDLWDATGFPWYASERATPPIWIDHAAYTERWWRENQPRMDEIRAVFGAYQWLQRKPYLLNKSPLNTYRVPHLAQAFPDAKFIHLVRDGRAVVQSYTRKQYTKNRDHREIFEPLGLLDEAEVIRKLADFWQASLDVVARDAHALGLEQRGKFIEITYETLCDDLRGTLGHLCAFVGMRVEDFAPSVWETTIRSQNHKWQTAFSDAIVADITARMHDGLMSKGYISASSA